MGHPILGDEIYVEPLVLLNPFSLLVDFSSRDPRESSLCQRQLGQGGGSSSMPSRSASGQTPLALQGLVDCAAVGIPERTRSSPLFLDAHLSPTFNTLSQCPGRRRRTDASAGRDYQLLLPRTQKISNAPSKS
eukprot:767286-Hanusia_phi.AAC.7